MLSRIVLATGSALFFLLMLLIAAYFALRSPWFYEKLQPELIARLQPLGITLDDPGSLRLDLLRAVSLRNAKIHWHDDELGDADLTVGAFDFNYALAPLLKGQVIIENLSLQDVQVTARIQSKPSAEEPASTAPMTLAQLETLLTSPPLPLTVKQVRLDNIQLDLRVDDGRQWQRLRGRIKHAGGQTQWQPERLQGRLGLMVDQPWMLARGDARQSQSVQFIPTLNSDLQWNLAMPDQAWQLQNFTMDNSLLLQQVEVSQTRDKERTLLGKVGMLDINLTGHSQSVNTTTGQRGLAGLFPLDLNTQLDTKTTDLTLTGFQQDDLKLDVLADQQLALDLKGNLQPFDASAPPLTLTTAQTLTIKKLEADYQGQQASIRDLDLKIDSSSDAPWREEMALPLSFKVDLDGKAKSVRWAQRAEGDEGTALSANMAPKLKFSAAGIIRSFDDLLQTLTLHFEPEITASQLAVRLGEGRKAERYRADMQSLAAIGDLKQGQLTLTADAALSNARIPQLLRKFSLNNHLDLATDLELTQPTLALQTVLDNRPLADIQLQAKNRAKELSLHHVVKANLTHRLKRLHAAASALDMSGDLKIDWDGDLTLQHGAPSLQTADFNKLATWPFMHHGNLGITQTRAPRSHDGIRLTAPLKAGYSLSTKNGTDFKTALHLRVPGVKTPPLVKAIPLQVWNQAEFDWPLKQVKTNGAVNIAGDRAASFRLQADNRPKRLDIDSRWSLSPREKWKKYLPLLASLDSVGGITTALWLKGKLIHPNQSILDFSAQQIPNMRAGLTLNTHITQSPGQPGSQVKLAAPVDLNQSLEWSGENAELTGRFNIASAQASGQIGLESLAGHFRVGANSGLTPDGGTFEIQITDGALLLHEQGGDQTITTNLKQVLVPLKLKVTARQTGEKILVDDFRLQTGGNFFDLQASGETTLDGKNAQITSTVTTRLRPDLLVNPYLSGAGSAQIPWRLVLLDGNQISIDGKIRFNDLDITTKPLQLHGLDGSLKIEEELLWSGKQLQYRYLEDPDPFQRVDFTRIQPFLDNRESLRVLSITMGEKSLGPGLASLQFKQNVLHLQQLDLDLFGGHLTGQVYLDTRPGNWKVGLLSRITQLDPRQLLAKDSPGRKGEYAPLSARTAIEFDIRQRLLQGRIDITKISRDQLFQLLEIIDPDYQDEQIAQLRSALRIAYPQKLSVEMHQGLLNLEVRVSALPAPLKIRGLPLTPLIQHFAGVALEALGKVPLE